jgi:hypothetical protein
MTTNGAAPVPAMSVATRVQVAIWIALCQILTAGVFGALVVTAGAPLGFGRPVAILQVPIVILAAIGAGLAGFVLARRAWPATIRCAAGRVTTIRHRGLCRRAWRRPSH